MNKNEIYVPIANKKEAKRAKAVLEAMGEQIAPIFWAGEQKEYGGVSLKLIEHKVWIISNVRYNIGEQTTLKQLIELLVLEKPAEPEKIAVRVDNEKEFNALMKYYDSLGWKCASGAKSLAIEYCLSNRYIYYHDNFLLISTPLSSEEEGYKIIPFSDFSKKHGIRVPILVSEDGFELFEGDLYFCVSNSRDWNDDLNDGNWHIRNARLEPFYLSTDSVVIKYPNSCKAFSTKQSALDWIEAQKPTMIEVSLSCDRHVAFIDKKNIKLRIGTVDSNTTYYLKHQDINAIHKAMEELNS